VISRPRGKLPACTCFRSVERGSILVSCRIVRNVVVGHSVESTDFTGGARLFVETLR
jgi:hypothetical protein